MIFSFKKNYNENFAFEKMISQISEIYRLEIVS